ncbi:hypothetical protein HKD37_15G043977 [Glycine soja]
MGYDVCMIHDLEDTIFQKKIDLLQHQGVAAQNRTRLYNHGGCTSSVPSPGLKTMATPWRSPPPPDSPSAITKRKTRQTTRLRRLTGRSLEQPRPIVNINPITGRGSGPHKEKFHSYLGLVVREKIPIVHSTWKDVPESLKIIIWEDILGKFYIPEGTSAKKKVIGNLSPPSPSDMYTLTKTVNKKKIHLLSMVWIEKHGKNLQRLDRPLLGRKYKSSTTLPTYYLVEGTMCLKKKLMAEKTKTRLNHVEFTENTDMVVAPPSPIARHVKWQMARTNKYGQMTSIEAQEISDKIEQTTHRTFVPHGRQAILNTMLGSPKHPSRVRVAGHGVTIGNFWTACQWLQQFFDNDHPIPIGGNHRKSKARMEERALVRPPNPDVLVARVSTKESCVEAVANVVAKDWSAVDETTMGKVCVLTIYNGDARVPFPTSEIQYDSNHNVQKSVGHVDQVEVAAESSGIVVGREPIWTSKYWGKIFHTHADVAEIISGHKCLNISILQLWIMMSAVEAEVMGHCMVSLSLSRYTMLRTDVNNANNTFKHGSRITTTIVLRSLLASEIIWLKNYLIIIVNFRAHWQLFVLCTRENMVVWFCSLRKMAMKIITSSFEGMSDQAAPRWVEPKSHVQTRGYECGYYWFCDGSMLDVEAMTTLRKKWATYFLAIRNRGC